MLTRLAPSTPTDYLLAAYFLFGLGFGLVNPPITDTAVAGMPPSQAGVAAGVASTSRQVGQTLGVARARRRRGRRARGPRRQSPSPSRRIAAWWIIAVLGVLIFVIGLLTTTDWAKATARETASRFGDARPRRYRASEAVPARASAR